MNQNLGGAANNSDEVICSGQLEKGSVPSDLLRGMSKNQRRKLVRYGKVPGKDSRPQNNHQSGQAKSPHPLSDLKEGEPMDHLFAKGRLGDYAAEILYKEIVKRQYPPHSRSFDTAQRLWERIINSKVKKRGGRPSN
ncbi:MAG: hypothetical protein FJ123_00020 [Deltaproteobacteria bacterium]|nr:hypothetical protein [Deltaproteobacteria bacterium]